MTAQYGSSGFQSISSMPPLAYADAETYKNRKDVRCFGFPSPSLCLYRSKTFQELGGWDPELLAAVDWEMYFRVINKGGGMVYLHDVLAIMRNHDNRHSATTAVTWDGYHDVLILTQRPEHRWGGRHKARVVSEQLLWDLRLRRNPKRTLHHAWRHSAISAFLLLLPYEVLRRSCLKLKHGWRKLANSSNDDDGEISHQDSCERSRLDRYWASMTQSAGQ